MREWNLTAASPLALRFASDSRLAPFDPVDDQVWEIALSSAADKPALSIQSVLGARVGLMRIDTLWDLPEQSVYAVKHFLSPFVVRAFAPNYARLDARLTPTLSITFELWVMAPRAVGGRYTMVNTGSAPVDLQLNIIPQIARESAKVTPRLTRLDDGLEVIALGRLPGLGGALLLDDSAQSHELQGGIPRLSAPCSVPGQGSVSKRWVHAGYATFEESLTQGRRWLTKTDWDSALGDILRLNAQIPEIETGDAAVDAALAFGLNTMLRNVGGPTSFLPRLTTVGARTPARGYAPRGATVYSTDWAGPTAASIWLSAPTLAQVESGLGSGALMAMLTTAGADGWVDWKPGVAGQRTGVLAVPLLASTAWALYGVTRDKHFLETCYPIVRAFFERWFAPDSDADSDGAPEWQNLMQAAQPEHPTFNRFRRWASNAEIRLSETPDLLALLLHEGEALHQIATVIGVSNVAPISARMAQLGAALQAMWQPVSSQFMARDRDTHQTTPAQIIFSGKGDQWLSESVAVAPVARLLFRVIGGQASPPSIRVHIEGTDQYGKATSETIALADFIWYYGLGSAITETVYREVHFAKVEGLSRVFQVEVTTADLTGVTLTASLPLWAGATDSQARSMSQAIMDPKRWLKRFGLPMSTDARFTTDNPNNDVSVFWNCLVIDGLLARGYVAEAQLLMTRLIQAQVNALQDEKHFSASYNANTGAGHGEYDDPLGIVPLHLYLKTVGIQILDATSVWAGGYLPEGMRIRVSQFGLTVTRDSVGTIVHFASGYETHVDSAWQLIVDPTAPASKALAIPTVRPAMPGPVMDPLTPDITETVPGAEPALPPPETVPERSPVSGTTPLTIPVQMEAATTVEVPVSLPDSESGAGKDDTPPVTYRIKVRRV